MNIVFVDDLSSITCRAASGGWRAAAEAAIGLAILVTLFRNRRTINVAELDSLKG